MHAQTAIVCRRILNVNARMNSITICIIFTLHGTLALSGILERLALSMPNARGATAKLQRRTASHHYPTHYLHLILIRVSQRSVGLVDAGHSHARTHSMLKHALITLDYTHGWSLSLRMHSSGWSYKGCPARIRHNRPPKSRAEQTTHTHIHTQTPTTTTTDSHDNKFAASQKDNSKSELIPALNLHIMRTRRRACLHMCEGHDGTMARWRQTLLPDTHTHTMSHTTRARRRRRQRSKACRTCANRHDDKAGSKFHSVVRGGVFDACDVCVCVCVYHHHVAWNRVA